MAQGEYILDRASVRSVDRAAIEEYGIPGMVLMENASRGLAAEAIGMLGDGLADARVLIVCGSGNNGGDGYALARHLHNAGVRPLLVALGEPRPGTDAATNRTICAKMGLPLAGDDRLDEQDDPALVVDAIFGTGLDRPVEGRPAEVIDWINRIMTRGRPVLAVDVPSGLDCDTGLPLGHAVRATATVTFVARKPGLLEPSGRDYAGRVTVADIGAPRELVERFGRPVGSVCR
jgi:NAD(P)H-hydrate epimerase